MKNGHDEDMVGLDPVDDPIASIDQLSDIVATLSLRDETANLRKVYQLFDRGNDPFGKAPGIIGRVLRDVGLQVPEIGSGPEGPLNHYAPAARP